MLSLRLDVEIQTDHISSVKCGTLGKKLSTHTRNVVTLSVQCVLIGPLFSF